MPSTKKSKLDVFVENAGDIAGILIANIHGIITVLVLSALIGLFASYAVAYPGGPGRFIGEVYATICTTGGSCDLSTLNGGAALAAVIMAGLGLAFLRSVKTDDPEARHDEILERFDDIVEILDEMTTRITSAEELINAGANPSAVLQDDPNALIARLEAVTNGGENHHED